MLVRQVQPAEEPAESAARKCQCYRRHRLKERDECATREPERAWITGGRREGDTDYRSGKTRVLRFLSDFFFMTVDEHVIAKMIAEVEATRWRLQETIRDRELAATHKLGQMRRLLMLEEHKAWNREFSFGRTETAAEMDEKRFRTSPVPDLFFYRNMSNPRRLHTPDEITLEMKVDAERLRMEIILSQPAPPKCDLLLRRAAVDSGSEEPGTLRRSPAIGTGSDEPGVSRVETSTDTEGTFPLGTSMDGFFYSNCTSPEQERVLLQPDVGIDDNDEATTSKVPVGVRKEFARPTKKQQRQRTRAWSTEQSKQFDRGRPTVESLLF